MARKKGGWNKFLDFIGLVDDDEPRDDYEAEDRYAGDYGAQSSYTPQRNTARPRQNERPQMSRRYDSYEPTRTPRMERQGGNSRPAQGASRGPARPQPARESRYTSSRFAQQGSSYDYTPRSSSRFDDSGSRFDRNYERGEGAQRASRNVNQQRTVMYTLHELTDCRDVIDNLVLNVTVVLTVEANDEILMRSLDILSGAAFALQATIRKASPYTYLIAPQNVDIDQT